MLSIDGWGFQAVSSVSPFSVRPQWVPHSSSHLGNTPIEANHEQDPPHDAKVIEHMVDGACCPMGTAQPSAGVGTGGDVWNGEADARNGVAAAAAGAVLRSFGFGISMISTPDTLLPATARWTYYWHCMQALYAGRACEEYTSVRV